MFRQGGGGRPPPPLPPPLKQVPGRGEGDKPLYWGWHDGHAMTAGSYVMVFNKMDL